MVTLNAYTFDEIFTFTLFLRTRFDGYFYHGGPQQAAFEVVASLILFKNRVIGGFLGLHHLDGVMNKAQDAIDSARMSSPQYALYR